MKAWSVRAVKGGPSTVMLVVMSLTLIFTACNNAKQTVKGAMAGSNFKIGAGDVDNLYPPNWELKKNIVFSVTTVDGIPVPGVRADFRAFDVTSAFKNGVGNDKIKAEITANWKSSNFVMDSAGSLKGSSCSAGILAEDCVGRLSGNSIDTNQRGEAVVGYTTPNLPGGVIAVAMRVPEESKASELTGVVFIRIATNEDFAQSGISPLQSVLLVMPPLFSDAGEQVIQAGAPFNLAVYVPGIPNTETGKGFLFDFSTEGLVEPANADSVVVPQGSRRCEFRNSQCIVPGGPFRVLKPTTLKFSAKPTDPKFPVRPASISMPVITGKASQLIVSLSPDTRNIQNACVDSGNPSAPCLVMSADLDSRDLYPMLVDAGGSWVQSPETDWLVESGPLLEPDSIKSSFIASGDKQILKPVKSTERGTPFNLIKVSVKDKPSVFMYIKYVVNPGVPKKLKFLNAKQQATVPFPVEMELRDDSDNFCYNYNGDVGMKLALTPLQDVGTPPSGLVSTLTKVDVLDRRTEKVRFSGGFASTLSADPAVPSRFLITKRPPEDVNQWPKIAIENNQITLASGQTVTVAVDSTALQVDAGPLTQTLWRTSLSGGGSSWKNLAGLDPVTGKAVQSDQQENFYLAGYDAAANYVGDVKDVKYWGVKYTLDDEDISVGSSYRAALNHLFGKNPSTYTSANCLPPATTPLAGQPNGGDYLNPDNQPDGAQPENNLVFCGIHLGLSNKGGLSAVSYNSPGIQGTGRILAIPDEMYATVNGSADTSTIKIRPALSPRLTMVAGAAKKFGLALVSAETATQGQIIFSRTPGVDDKVPTGHRFKIRVYALDSSGTETSYAGEKSLQVTFLGDKSWAGLYPDLPNGVLTCTFVGASCDLPGPFVLTDATKSASLTVRQLSPSGGVQGNHAVVFPTTPGSPSRLLFASQKGGPTAGAVVENSLEVPLGRVMKTDEELALAVAVTDAGGSYVRDALPADQIVYDGFRSDDGEMSSIFTLATGAWANSAPWTSSYTPYDVFVSTNDSPSKFYNPDDSSNPPQVLLPASKNTALYTTVFVPQNRIGRGYAVPRSLANPALIGFPSSWWRVEPGNPEHIETKLIRGTAVNPSWSKVGLPNPTEAMKQNWVAATDSCYDMIITMHDKKHNIVSNFTAVVPEVVFKLMNVTTAKPNGVDDSYAGTFLQALSNNTVTSSYYQTHNAVRVPGPYRDGFYIVGMSPSDGGSFSSFAVPDDDYLPGNPSLNDWWKGTITLTAGVMSTGLKVCPKNGQTEANYARTDIIPYAEKFIQLDMPAVVLGNGLISYPAFQSRGAGVRFSGPNGQTVGSTATPHDHGDIVTVFRADVDHLHPTFVDDVFQANQVVTDSFSQSFLPGNSSPPVIGVTDRCPFPKCGQTTIYWHEHDVAHNFVRPARTNGFATWPDANIGSPGPLGSASSVILASNHSRVISVNEKSIYASNQFVPQVFLTDYLGAKYKHVGARFQFRPGPPVSLAAWAASETTTLSTDAPFGLGFQLKDQYGNRSGGADGFDLVERSYHTPRTLTAWFSSQPSNAPNGTGVPRLMGRNGNGTNLTASDPSPVSMPIAFGYYAAWFGGLSSGSNTSSTAIFSALDSSRNIQLVKADELLTLNVKVQENTPSSWCASNPLNCPNSGTLTASMSLNPAVGSVAGTVITAGPSSWSLQYPVDGDPNALASYNAIFNTNPGDGFVYPILASGIREFTTYVCSRDQYGNAGYCNSPGVFEFVDLNPASPAPVSSESSMNNVSQFDWKARGSGTFKIRATKNGFTTTTAPISIDRSPLSSFGVERLPPVTDVIDAGQEISMRVCMRDNAGAPLTSDVWIGGEQKTEVDGPITLTIDDISLAVSPEFKKAELSRQSGGNFDNGRFAIGDPVELNFTAGCAPFYAKLYAAATYNVTDFRLLVSHTAELQGGRLVIGRGLTISQVRPLTLDHFATTVSGLSSTPEANSTQAWADRGNQLASSGGNRFDVTAFARDTYGNPVALTGGTVNFSLLQSDGVTEVPSGRLLCSDNSVSCLTQLNVNASSVTLSGLAVDIGGQYFYIKASSGSYPFFAGTTSTKINAVASRKTVKEYKITAPTTMQAGVNTSVTVQAIDNSGATIVGADADLNALVFEWIDGQSTPGLLSARTAPNNDSPNLPAIGGTGAGKFVAGSATVNNFFLVKKEPSLIINVRDNQSPTIRSTNTLPTAVTAGTGLTYQITCTKDTGGAIATGQPCDGTSTTPASILASASDRFSLQILPFDQYKNPRPGNSGEILEIELNSFSAGGGNKGFLEMTAPSLQADTNSDLIVDLSNEAGTIVSRLFHRAANHTVSYKIKNRDSYSWTRIYHQFTPSIDMVYNYAIAGIDSHTAGAPQSLTITAYDRAGNIARGAAGAVDAALRGQTYQWSGPTGGVTFPKTGANPTAANQITFTNGVSESLPFTFRKAEVVNFSVRDYYTPVEGVGGTGTGGTRISNTRSFTVGSATATRIAMEPTTTIPNAGVGFGVTVRALDAFDNVVTSYPTDTLTFSWANASSSVTNPKNPSTTFNPVPAGSWSASMTSGVFTSGASAFTLYRTGETPTLTVTSTTNPSFTATSSFTPAANANHGYVKVTSASAYSAATELTGTRDITTDQTATLYAHMFDEYGNWKGNTFNVVWSGSLQLDGKVTTPGFTSTLTPNIQGSGQVTATCSGLTTGCVSFTTGVYTVNAGLVSKFVWLSPTPSAIDQTTENCVEYRLQVQDQQNNPVAVSADYGITFRAVKAGATDTSGDFFRDLAECQAAQLVANSGSLTTAGFHSATTLSGTPGNRVANISNGSNAVSVWYANRTTTATGAASLTATSGTVTNSRTGQINAGPPKRFAITAPTSNLAINASGAGSSGARCGEITYKFQDKWGNDRPLTTGATINLQTSSGNGAFYSDSNCSTLIAGSARSAPSATATQDTVYYSDSRSNRATITLLQTSTLSGNNAIEAQTRTAIVSPNTFAISSPVSDSSVRDASGSLGPLVSWAASTGAQDYTVTYGSTSACDTSFPSNTTTGTLLNLPTGINGTTFVCVIANGFSGGTPVPTLQATNTPPSPYRLRIDNSAPSLTSLSVPATGSSFTPTVSFSLSEAATVTLYSNNTCTVAISSAASLASGANTMTTNSLTANTSTTIYAQAEDAAGNRSTCNATGTFATYIHDNVNPSITLFTITSPGNSRRPGQSFTLSENATVTLYSNSSCTTAVSNPTSVTGGASRTVAMTVDLAADSASTVYAVAVDPAGNSSTCNASGTFASYTHDGTAPTVSRVTSATANGSFMLNGVIVIDVLFSENVTVTGTPSPQLALNSHASSANATYLSGSGTSTLKFSYTVGAGQNAADLDVLSSSALTNGTIQDAAGNNATRTLPTGTNTESLASLKDFVIDTTAPAFSSITVPARGTSQTPSVSFTLSEATTANGLILYSNVGCTTAISAAVTGASGSNSVTTSTLTANASTTIYARATDIAGNQSTCASLGTYIHDNVAPTVTSVTSNVTNGHFRATHTVDIRVVFSEAVNFSGSPTITLETGDTDAVVTITGGDGTTTLTGTYTVAAGHTSADLDYTATNALTAGTFIRDLAGNTATLTLPAVGGTGSLGANKNIVIDTTAPTVAFSSITPTGPSSTTNPTVRGTTSDTNNTGVNVVLYFGADCTGTARGTATQANFTSTGITVTASVTTNNSTAIRAIATDQAGNASACTLMTTYTHDSTGPSISGMPTNVTVNEQYTVPTAPTVTDSNGPITYSWAASGASLNGCTVTITNGTTLTPSFSFGSCNNNTFGNFGVATLTLTATDAASNSSTANFTLTWDAESPRVSTINVNDTVKGNRFYKSGDTVPIDVTFTKTTGNPNASTFVVDVATSGTPSIPLNTGGSATYSTGTGTRTLRFNYVVQSTDFSGIQAGSILNLAASSSAISLNGATMRDRVGTNRNNAHLGTLPFDSTNGIQSILASPNNGSIIVDNVAPVAAIASGMPSAQSNNRSPAITVCRSGSGSPCASANTDTATISYKYVAGTACTTGGYTGPVSASNSLPGDLSSFGQGDVTICLLATDPSGNTQSTATINTYTLDTIAPAQVNITAPTNNQQLTSQPVTISWDPPAADVLRIDLIVSRDSTCSSNNVESYVDGTPDTRLLGTATTRTLSTSNLADGLYYICMFTYDTAGNKSGMSGRSFEIESDVLHISWTDNGGVKYSTKSGNGNWSAAETVANIGTMDSRSSLVVNNGGAAIVGFQYDDGTQSHYTYRRRVGANNWFVPGSTLISTASSFKTGLFGEIALNNQTTARIFASSYGYIDNDGAEGLVLTDSSGSKQLRVATVAATPSGLRDTSVTVDAANNPYVVASVLSGTNYRLKVDNSVAGVTADLSLPTSCADAPYVSSFARSSGVIGMAIACRMSNDNSCRVWWGETTYTSNFSAPTWTQVGIIKASSCVLSDLTPYERPSITYDRLNSNRVSIAWIDKTNKTLNRWSDESGTGGNEMILTMTGTGNVGQPSIALDKTGKSYIVYQDGNSLRLVHNNARPNGNFIGSWSSPTANEITTANISGVGNIGITGMKGRSNTSGGN